MICNHAGGNAELCCSCAWECKGPSHVCVRSVREIAVAALLALGDCEARRASDESVGARPMQLGSEESVFFDCCFASSLRQ